MPGKGDAGAQNAGQSFPGSKEWRAWDEGWRARYAGIPFSQNPISGGERPVEYYAWRVGWFAAHQNIAGARRMPATTGAP